MLPGVQKENGREWPLSGLPCNNFTVQYRPFIMHRIQKLIVFCSVLALTACSGEEERRGTPHDQGSLPAEQSTGGPEVRPEVDGSEAVGQSPHDTVGGGREGATSY